MIVTVRLFAAVRQAAGADNIQLQLEEPVRVADVRQALIERFPGSAALLQRTLIALDTEYATDDQPVSAAAEIALIPPVSGG